MKSRIKLILAFVLSMLMVFAFAGCANMANGDNGENGESGGGLDDTLLIYDFEQWKPDFSGTHISDRFGRVSLNTDATYVAHGKGSAKIEPEGGGWMYIQTASDTFGYDNSDFTHVSGVQVKFYNATEESMPVVMGFVTKVTLYDSFERICDTTFTLAPGWNTVTLELPAEIMCYMADVTDIPGISFSFPNGVDSENNQTVFYLDDVRLTLTVEANTSSPEDFPYDFAGYAAENKLVAFEDDYSDQFFIHEKESEMAVVNALVEKNGLGEIIGLPEESRPDEDYVFKTTIVPTKAWTESGGLNGKLLRDTLKEFDPEVLNAPGARITFRIYATSAEPTSVVNRFIANLRFRTVASYVDFYTQAGEYFNMNQWYDYNIPLSSVLSNTSFASSKVGTDLARDLTDITLYTNSYLKSSNAIVPYTIYMSDFHIKAPNYETEKGKLINFQSEGSVDFIERQSATELSLVDAAAETNFNGEPIGIPYADNDDRKGDKQVLKVEVPESTTHWDDDTIAIPVDMLKFGFDEYEAGALDKNATISFKMYITGDNIDQVCANPRAWYDLHKQISAKQVYGKAHTWLEVSFKLGDVMDNTNFNSANIDALLGKLRGFTFRGPVQVPKSSGSGYDNVQRARTMYFSDFYLTPATPAA